jgi:hypothetical protein
MTTVGTMEFAGSGAQFVAAFQNRIDHILESNGAYFDGRKKRGHAQKGQNIAYNIIQPYPIGVQKGIYPTIDIQPKNDSVQTRFAYNAFGNMPFDDILHNRCPWDLDLPPHYRSPCPGNIVLTIICFHDPHGGGEQHPVSSIQSLLSRKGQRSPARTGSETPAEHRLLQWLRPTQCVCGPGCRSIKERRKRMRDHLNWPRLIMATRIGFTRPYPILLSAMFYGTARFAAFHRGVHSS